MITALIVIILSRIGEGLHGATPVALVAFLLSLYGQYQMLRFQTNRVNLLTGEIMVLEPSDLDTTMTPPTKEE